MKLSRAALALPVALVLILGAVVPLLVFVVISFFIVDFDAYELIPGFSLQNWGELFTKSSYGWLIGKAVANGLVTVLVTALIGYPVALALSRLGSSLKGLALVVLLTPLYTGEVVRVYAWRLVLGNDGLINSALKALGLIREPLGFLLFTPFSTHLALVYDDLPFMVLALWISAEFVDRRLIEAARDLGCRPLQAFGRVVLPLTGSGLAAGAFAVFALAAGEALAPALLGGTSGATPMAMIDSLFGTAFDWPMASVLSLALLVALVVSASLLATLLLHFSGGRRLAMRRPA